eukprot:gene29708-10748_t
MFGGDDFLGKAHGHAKHGHGHGHGHGKHGHGKHHGLHPQHHHVAKPEHGAPALGTSDKDISKVTGSNYSNVGPA